MSVQRFLEETVEVFERAEAWKRRHRTRREQIDRLRRLRARRIAGRVGAGIGGLAWGCFWAVYSIAV